MAIEMEIIDTLTREQLVTLAKQQQQQMELEQQIVESQEKRIKELETEVAYLENMVANQRSIDSQAKGAA